MIVLWYATEHKCPWKQKNLTGGQKNLFRGSVEDQTDKRIVQSRNGAEYRRVLSTILNGTTTTADTTRTEKNVRTRIEEKVEENEFIKKRGSVLGAEKTTKKMTKHTKPNRDN